MNKLILSYDYNDTCDCCRVQKPILARMYPNHGPCIELICSKCIRLIRKYLNNEERRFKYHKEYKIKYVSDSEDDFRSNNYWIDCHVPEYIRDYDIYNLSCVEELDSVHKLLINEYQSYRQEQRRLSGKKIKPVIREEESASDFDCPGMMIL